MGLTFVAGTGRCGSTLLSRVMARHPDVLSMSEFFGILRLAGATGRSKVPAGDTFEALRRACEPGTRALRGGRRERTGHPVRRRRHHDLRDPAGPRQPPRNGRGRPPGLACMAPGSGLQRPSRIGGRRATDRPAFYSSRPCTEMRALCRIVSLSSGSGAGIGCEWISAPHSWGGCRATAPRALSFRSGAVPLQPMDPGPAAP